MEASNLKFGCSEKSGALHWTCIAILGGFCKKRGDWKETCGLLRGRAMCSHGACAAPLAAWRALAGRFTTVGSSYQVSVGGCLLLSSLL